MNRAPDITSEITFRTARSGGKGGQNVNKVESMVEGYFDIANSTLFDDHQKDILLNKLRNRINAEGKLFVKSQVHRSQLSNKAEVIRKMNELIAFSLRPEKKRIATKPSASSKERRKDAKKKVSETKKSRQKIRYNE